MSAPGEIGVAARFLWQQDSRLLVLFEVQVADDSPLIKVMVHQRTRIPHEVPTGAIIFPLAPRQQLRYDGS